MNKRGRKTFLAFVTDGMAGEWDAAARRHYGYADVAKLEEVWLKRSRVTTWSRRNSPVDGI